MSALLHDIGKARGGDHSVVGARLAADLAAGGLTFGAGALLGGLLGAAGARGIASAYNLARGSDASTVRWSSEFLTGRVAAAMLRYLAVAHFGRGRGDYVASEYPPHWGPLVESCVAVRRAELEAQWSAAGRGESAAALEARLRPQLEAITEDVLARLYPTGSPLRVRSRAVSAAAGCPGPGFPR